MAEQVLHLNPVEVPTTCSKWLSFDSMDPFHTLVYFVVFAVQLPFLPTLCYAMLCYAICSCCSCSPVSWWLHAQHILTESSLISHVSMRYGTHGPSTIPIVRDFPSVLKPSSSLSSEMVSRPQVTDPYVTRVIGAALVGAGRAPDQWLIGPGIPGHLTGWVPKLHYTRVFRKI